MRLPKGNSLLSGWRNGRQAWGNTRVLWVLAAVDKHFFVDGAEHVIYCPALIRAALAILLFFSIAVKMQQLNPNEKLSSWRFCR